MTQPDFSVAPDQNTLLKKQDQPLSARGRFNRLSYLGWYGFLNIVTVLIYAILALFFGVLDLNQLTANQSLAQVFSGTVGIAVLVIWLLAVYFHVVFVIRRLHDLNRTGWLWLLLLVPIVQIFFLLYLLIAPGTKGINQYGPPRYSAVWEKILAWIMVIFMVLITLLFANVVSFIWTSDNLYDPSEFIERGTSYF